MVEVLALVILVVVEEPLIQAALQLGVDIILMDGIQQQVEVLQFHFH